MTFLRILIQYVDELLNRMSVLTGDKRFEDAQNTYDKKKRKNKKRGTVKNMFLYEYDEEKHKKFLREEGFEEGYSVGEKSGYAAGEKRNAKKMKLINKLATEGKTEDIIKATSDEKYLQALLDKYGIS